MACPIIGLICCQKDIHGQPGQAVQEKYIDGVSNAGGMPILLPRELNDFEERERVFSMLDGFVLTGSYSNVAPERYFAKHKESYTDLFRDELTWHILDYVMAKDLPLLAICRGHQEMNAYFGGTLIPDWRGEARFTLPHLEDNSLPLKEQYGDKHLVEIQTGGILSAFPDKQVMVNSLHKQCVGNVAPKLHIEAIAPDGMIEGLSVPNKKFILSVQWHPEFMSLEKPMSKYIFAKFIQACGEK